MRGARGLAIGRGLEDALPRPVVRGCAPRSRGKARAPCTRPPFRDVEGLETGSLEGALGFTFEIALYVRTLPSVDFLEVIFDNERLEGGVRCKEQRVVRVALFGEGTHVPPLVKPEIA